MNARSSLNVRAPMPPNALSLVRSTAVTVMTVFAPLVELVGGAAMLLGIGAALLFKTSAAGPHFPFWPVLALSFGMGGAVILYHPMIALLTPPERQ